MGRFYAQRHAHSLQPSAQAILGEQAEGAIRLLSGMQAKLQEQERQQRIAIHHYHCDHLGTPMALTDQTGQVAWAAKLDPWGNVLQEYNPQGIHQAIRLPGQHHDRETGLYYNRHRYYDPVLGNYVNQDPIGLTGGVNISKYPDNPVAFIDPMGLSALAGSLPVAGGLAAADGPLPIGDILAVILLTGAVVYDLTKCLQRSEDKKKCKDATPDNIRSTVSKSPLLTTQKAVSVPAVAAYTKMIEAGSTPPPVKMDGVTIVDGYHRMVAAMHMLCDVNPPVEPGTAPLSTPKYPFKDIYPDTVDWGNR